METVTAQIEGLIAEWRSSADWMMGSTNPDEWQKGGSGYLRQNADQLAALLPAICEMEAENARLKEEP